MFRAASLPSREDKFQHALALGKVSDETKEGLEDEGGPSALDGGDVVGGLAGLGLDVYVERTVAMETFRNGHEVTEKDALIDNTRTALTIGGTIVIIVDHRCDERDDLSTSVRLDGEDGIFGEVGVIPGDRLGEEVKCHVMHYAWADYKRRQWARIGVALVLLEGGDCVMTARAPDDFCQ